MVIKLIYDAQLVINGTCDTSCPCCYFIVTVDALVDLDSPIATIDAVGGDGFEGQTDTVEGVKGTGCACGT